MLTLLRQLPRDLADLVLPGTCIACHAHTPHSRQRFCNACDELLRTLEDRPQCTECGAPVATEGSPCQRCFGRGYRSFEQVVNLGVFTDPLAQLIHRLKFGHGWTIGSLLGDRAHRLQRVKSALEDVDVIVPIPLHWRRHIVRGFDQARVFARRLSQLSGKPLAKPVVRIRATEAQSLQKRADRMRNIRNAFGLVAPRSVEGRRVLIVDDVMTTGSTLKTFARVLKRANPQSLSVLTIAIADPKGHAFEAV